MARFSEITECLKGKKIFLTGDTGFKGSWLSLWLNHLGADVVGFALPPVTERDHYKLLDLGILVHHIDGDIRDIATLRSAIKSFQPEIVFHLAAQPLVRRSYSEPKETFDTNIAGSVNLLEVCRETDSIRAIVYVTSDKCYKNREWIWGYREDDELGGLDPYSASKAAAEMVFGSYLHSYFLDAPKLGVASVRAGNVIGGGDWSKDRIVPDCIRALERQQPIVLRNPSSTRPWQHVLEPLGGYILLACKLYSDPKRFTGSWNFGPDSGNCRSVNELASKIIEVWGGGRIEAYLSEEKPLHEAGLLNLCCDKARHLLDWRPAWGFEQSVRETTKWYRDYAECGAVRTLSRGQITRYMEEIG